MIFKDILTSFIDKMSYHTGSFSNYFLVFPKRVQWENDFFFMPTGSLSYNCLFATFPCHLLLNYNNSPNLLATINTKKYVFFLLFSKSKIKIFIFIHTVQIVLQMTESTPGSI